MKIRIARLLPEVLGVPVALAPAGIKENFFAYLDAALLLGMKEGDDKAKSISPGA